MKQATRKRLETLEAHIPARRCGKLDVEIREMVSEERNALRQFLLHAKAGGKPGEKIFDALQAAADMAVSAARGRLCIAHLKP